MKKTIKCSLVILAAGMGSRYGGLKQLDFMTPEKETIIDFSIYDAIEAGFSKIVFVIRKSFEKEFKQLFDAKLKGKVEVKYVFQEIEKVPKKWANPERIKPWGTGHAILMAKEVVSENFAVINADDYYGKNSFKTLFSSLQNTDKTSSQFYLMGYFLKNTLSKFGSVSRGECIIDKNQYLQSVIERTNIHTEQNSLFFKDDDPQKHPISQETIVSMNFWGFTPQIFSFLEELFLDFLAKNSTNLTAEFFIPTVIDSLIKNKKATVKVLKATDKWLGVTYKEDKPFIIKAFSELKKQGKYPKKMW